jgi:hypothetical protein
MAIVRPKDRVLGVSREAAAHLGQAGGEPTHILVLLVPGLQPGAAEHRDAVKAQLRRRQGLELFDRVPEADDRAVDDLADIRRAADRLFRRVVRHGVFETRHPGREDSFRRR